MILGLSVAVVAAAAGLLLSRWLDRRTYRYDVEQALPTRRTSWVVPPLVVAAGLLAWAVGPATALLVSYGIAFIWMAGLAVIDVDVRRLPDAWTLPSYPVAAALLAWCAHAEGDWSRWRSALVAGAVSGAIYLLLAVVNPAGMGMGDVKLSVTLGMLTGWWGWPVAVLAFLAAFVIGLVVGVVVAVRSGEGRKAAFPLGPSMLAGAVLAILLVAPTVN